MPDQPASLAGFREFRERMNYIILNAGNLTINRFFALEEMLGLVSSLVLRCDDCITYHVRRETEVTSHISRLTPR